MITLIKVQEEEENPDDVAMFVESQRGKTILQYKGYRYRRGYKTKNGFRWLCSVNKNCGAFIYLNSKDEIIMSNEIHEHTEPTRFDYVDADQSDAAILITSRKGKEILLFRQYTYRKQYMKKNRSRWVCSNLKNCRACVFTDENNFITQAFEEHGHPPPKYYLKPANVISALRERVEVETE